MDSLFAGMDFVNPLSFPVAEASPRSLSALRELDDFSDQAKVSAPSAETIPTQKVLDSLDQILTPHNGSIDSILAAYDRNSSKCQPPLSKQSLDALRPGVRRKRRSVKIGYGRDDVEDGRSASETASNGSAIEDQSIGLPELSVVAHDGTFASRQEAEISPARNGSNGHQEQTFTASGDFDAKQEELADNFSMLMEQLDIGDVDMQTSAMQSLDVGPVHDNMHEVVQPLPACTSTSNILEAEELGLEQADEILQPGEAEPGEAGKEEHFTPPQSAHATEAQSSADVNFVNKFAISPNIASKSVCHEGESDVLELKIKLSPCLSMKERLTFIQYEVAKHAECIQQRIAAISQARKAATQKRRELAEEVSRTSTKYKEVEGEIQIACEREDFETAEKLDEALVLAEKAREAALEEFQAAETENDKFASKLQEVLQMQITSEEESVLLLEQLGKDTADTADQLKKDSDKKGKEKIDFLATDETAIKLEKEKLMLEVRIVDEAKAELNNAIKSSIHTEAEEKQTLVDEQQILQQELDALLAAVRSKESQIAEHEKKIGDLEERINSRVAGFDKETVELETNFQNLVIVLDSLEKKYEGLDAQKIRVDADVAQAQEAAEKLDELSRVAKMEAQKLQDALLVRKAAAQAARSSKEKRLSLASQEKQHAEDAHSLRNQLASSRILLQELASDKVKLHQELLSANQQISSIEKRGPEIEAEKKLAAGSRNFKEAGRLAAEAKALLLSKEKLVSEVKRVSEGLQRLERELESRMSELLELEGQLQGKEKEAAVARYERLRLLATATRDERDGAVEVEDFEEAKSLDMEADAADREADEVWKEFGLDGDA